MELILTPHGIQSRGLHHSWCDNHPLIVARDCSRWNVHHHIADRGQRWISSGGRDRQSGSESRVREDRHGRQSGPPERSDLPHPPHVGQLYRYRGRAASRLQSLQEPRQRGRYRGRGRGRRTARQPRRPHTVGLLTRAYSAIPRSASAPIEEAKYARHPSRFLRAHFFRDIINPKIASI